MHKPEGWTARNPVLNSKNGQSEAKKWTKNQRREGQRWTGFFNVATEPQLSIFSKQARTQTNILVCRFVELFVCLFIKIKIVCASIRKYPIFVSSTDVKTHCPPLSTSRCILLIYIIYIVHIEVDNLSTIVHTRRLPRIINNLHMHNVVHMHKVLGEHT